MGFYPGSVETGLANNRPAHVVLVDAQGLPVFSSPAGGNSVATAATITTQPANANSIVLDAADNNRKELILTNTSNKTMLVAYAAVATTALYTLPIGKGVTETVRNYAGIVSAIWDGNNPNGNVIITKTT